MTNAELIRDLFDSNFSQHKEQNIVIYGLSLGTQAVVEGCKGYNILGLLDGMKTSGELYGKPILNIKDCPQLKTDFIVIVARKSTTKIIKNRIFNFCQENGIGLFNILGEDLMIENDNYQELNPYFNVSYESLIQEIDKYEVISFDMFDTLVMRKVLLPRDVFEIISDRYDFDFDFVDERIKAEQELLQYTNPTIEEIYRRLAERFNIDPIKMAKIELDTEMDVLLPRYDILQAFNYAVKHNKNVFIVSDMYFRSCELSYILKALGITGYNEIIVSCEYGISKSNGLFDVLKKKVGKTKILHIGDNEEADGESANLYDIDSLLIKSSLEMLDISSIKYLNKYDFMSNYNTRLHVGLLLSKIFNSPFALYQSRGKLNIKSEIELGFLIAPIITEFVLWLDRTTKEDNCETVFLAARDGSLIKKCCSYLDDDVRFIYFLTSRATALNSAISNKEDIKMMLKIPYTGSPEELLKNRFLLPNEEIMKYDGDSDISDYVLSHEEIIIHNSQRMKKNYLTYINNILVNLSNKVAFFDFVSSGSAQLGIEKILNKKLYGYYFINVFDDNQEKKKLNIKSMCGEGLAFGINNNIYDKYIFLENILSSEMPSLKEFDVNGNPLYCKEYRSADEINSVLKIQDSIVSYFNNYNNLTKKQDPIFDLADGILGLLDGSKSVINSKLLASLVLRDDFNGTIFESNSFVQ